MGYDLFMLIALALLSMLTTRKEDGKLLHNVDGKTFKVCLLSRDDNVTHHCYDFSGYYFAPIPKQVTKMEIMKVGEKLYVKEYYDSFYLLKIGKGIKKLNAKTTKEAQREISVMNIRIPQNTFGKSNTIYPKCFIYYNDVCDFIESLAIYNVYRSRRFTDGISLARTEVGIVERIESDYHVESFRSKKRDENVLLFHSIFHSFYRTMIAEAEHNPKVDVILDTKFHEAIFTQSSEGVTLETKEARN
ncbi:unnamed protein product [Gordionus sp. m RMFG-2023]